MNNIININKLSDEDLIREGEKGSFGFITKRSIMLCLFHKIDLSQYIHIIREAIISNKSFRANYIKTSNNTTMFEVGIM